MAAPRLPRAIELGKMLATAGRRRQAWCILSPLAHVSAPDGGLKAVLFDLRKEFEKAENLAALSPETHFLVRHPNVIPGLYDVMVELDEAVPLGPQTPPEIGASGVGHLDPRTPVGKTFMAVAERLGLADPILMRATELPAGFRSLDVDVPHVVVRSELFQLLQPAETNFLLAAALEQARPGPRLITSLEPDRLKVVLAGLFAACGLVPETPETAETAAKVRNGAGAKLAAWTDRLRDLAPRLQAGEPLADKLRLGVEETSRRVGLVAAGELRFVARMMTRIDPGLPKLQMSGKMAEIEEFFAGAPAVLSLLAYAATAEFGKAVGG